MLCTLIGFALVDLKFLMVKVCAIISISNNEFFDISYTERVKQNKKKKKNLRSLKTF